MNATATLPKDSENGDAKPSWVSWVETTPSNDTRIVPTELFRDETVVWLDPQQSPSDIAPQTEAEFLALIDSGMKLSWDPWAFNLPNTSRRTLRPKPLKQAKWYYSNDAPKEFCRLTNVLTFRWTVSHLKQLAALNVADTLEVVAAFNKRKGRSKYAKRLHLIQCALHNGYTDYSESVRRRLANELAKAYELVQRRRERNEDRPTLPNVQGTLAGAPKDTRYRKAIGLKWRTSKRYPGIYVSSKGHILRVTEPVKSLQNEGTANQRERIKLQVADDGDKWHQIDVSRLVWEVWKGTVPYEIDHEDNNPMNCDLDNLEEVTREENEQRKHERRRNKKLSPKSGELKSET